MTAKSFWIALWVTLILCVYAAVEAADEAAVTVQLLKALFGGGLDVEIGGQP
jgi:hypothetical protein